jgi:hypothetical protein
LIWRNIIYGSLREACRMSLLAILFRLGMRPWLLGVLALICAVLRLAALDNWPVSISADALLVLDYALAASALWSISCVLASWWSGPAKR